MITRLETSNHEIVLERFDGKYTITPYYYKDAFGINKESMGEIVLNKTELAILITRLTELIHGQ